MLTFIRTHRLAVALGGIASIAALAWLAIGYFGVHTLFIDEEVAEAVPVFDASAAPQSGPSVPVPTSVSPTVAPATVAPETVPPDTVTAETVTAETVTAGTVTAGTVPVPPPTAAAPVIVTEASGMFRSLDHPTAGDAVVLGNGTGQRFLRFGDFQTDNAPDLDVYLVNSSTGDVSDYIDLGDLKGNIGEQNYEIPAGTDLSVYDRVVIWCVRFGVAFGDATLESAAST